MRSRPAEAKVTGQNIGPRHGLTTIKHATIIPEAYRGMVRPIEGAAIVLGFFSALAWFHIVDGFEAFVEFVQSYESVELDEVLFALLLGGFAALFLAVRRTIDLRREICARSEAEERAARLAHDPLTGLANRHLLAERIASFIQAQTPFALILIDLDKFKPVNDVHGHEVGDELLTEVAHRLRNLDERVFVARLGGDEFVVLTWNGVSRAEIAALAKNIITALRQPFFINQRNVVIGATAGVARFPDDATTRQDLLRGADLAMYSAKRAGRGTYAFFHSRLDQGAQERAELELQIRAALAEGEIKPYFQPVFDLATKAISGFEALARWEHPTKGVIEPSSFIPIIEDLGLQYELLDVILHGAVGALSSRQPGMPLAVNIGCSQIQDPLFPARLLASLHQTGVDPSQLILEVTESALEGDADQMAQNFASLHSFGVRIALDDFGKSYSNLSSLRQLRFDHLKIHGSFVRDAEDPDSDVLRAIISLANGLSMPARAQGVETPELAALLASLGCEHAQGFHFGGVMDNARLDGMLSELDSGVECRAA